MNEPSVFNRSEVSMRKNAIEYREWHNLYGMYYHQATFMHHFACSPDSSRDPTLLERPFVLIRAACWAGSQRYDGAMWIEVKTTDWGHLQIANHMLLSIDMGELLEVLRDLEYHCAHAVLFLSRLASLYGCGFVSLL